MIEVVGSSVSPTDCVVDGVSSATDRNNPGKLVASTAASSESVDVVVPVVEETPRFSHREMDIWGHTPVTTCGCFMGCLFVK